MAFQFDFGDDVLGAELDDTPIYEEEQQGPAPALAADPAPAVPLGYPTSTWGRSVLAANPPPPTEEVMPIPPPVLAEQPPLPSPTARPLHDASAMPPPSPVAPRHVHDEPVIPNAEEGSAVPLPAAPSAPPAIVGGGADALSPGISNDGPTHTAVEIGVPPPPPSREAPLPATPTREPTQSLLEGISPSAQTTVPASRIPPAAPPVAPVAEMNAQAVPRRPSGEASPAAPNRQLQALATGAKGLMEAAAVIVSEADERPRQANNDAAFASRIGNIGHSATRQDDRMQQLGADYAVKQLALLEMLGPVGDASCVSSLASHIPCELRGAPAIHLVPALVELLEERQRQLAAMALAHDAVVARIAEAVC